MRVFLANSSRQSIGGGWSFISNLKKGLGDEVTEEYEQSDVYFIPSASMVTREEVLKAKADGKKVVLRVDNAIRNSNNRNTGMSRLYDFAQIADLVIYQSNWARDFLNPFLKKDGVVILNGVDTKFYTPGNPKDDTYLYARSSRDEGKQWIMAWYWFVNHSGHLDIVGKFSPENMEYNFDFYNDERYTFWGQRQSLFPFYQSNKYLLYTYLNDACSNTLLEARACGMEIVDVNGMLGTGGAPEIMALEDLSLERMCREYKEALDGILV